MLIKFDRHRQTSAGFDQIWSDVNRTRAEIKLGPNRAAHDQSRRISTRSAPASTEIGSFRPRLADFDQTCPMSSGRTARGDDRHGGCRAVVRFGVVMAAATKRPMMTENINGYTDIAETLPTCYPPRAPERYPRRTRRTPMTSRHLYSTVVQLWPNNCSGSRELA